MHNFTLQVEGSFDAGHRLLGYQGTCAQWHGHTYRCLAVIEVFDVKIQDVLDGMLVDFTDIAECWQQYDHGNLNDFFGVPTAENIAVATLEAIEEIVEEQCGSYPAMVTFTLWEGDHNSVTVTNAAVHLVGSGLQVMAGEPPCYECGDPKGECGCAEGIDLAPLVISGKVSA